MTSKFALVVAFALSLVRLPVAPASGSTSVSDLRPGARVAIDYVRAHHADFGIAKADAQELEVTDATRSKDSGLIHIYLRQQVNRLPVIDGTIAVAVRDGRVFHTGSRLIADLAGKASGNLRLAPADALRSAVTHLHARAPHQTDAPVAVYASRSDGALRLSWELEIQDASHWLDVAIDAENGAIVETHDLVDHDHAAQVRGSVGRADGVTPTPVRTSGPGDDGATYNVYALPLESPNDGPRTLVTNPALPAASPYGWHDTNGTPGAESTMTQGNNVNAAFDPVGPANVGQLLGPVTHADGGASLNFDFPIDTSLPPITYKDAAVTSLFYWNNIAHDVFYGYGFDESSGNFQQDNYDKWPIGDSDPVQADAQDTGGVNNANFGTPAEGHSPRMQMFVWQVGRQLFDGDIDAGVMLHEFGHGVSNRLTGGAGNVRCLDNAEQGGEGWSDFLAISTLVLPGDVGTTSRGVGTYVEGQHRRTDTGIRPTRYKWNPTKSSTSPTYDFIKSHAEVHDIGYTWAEMLWEVFWEVTNEHGFNPDVYGAWNTGGNNRAVQLVFDGMKLQPCSPGFVDARDAILAADVALTGGEDTCAIWRGFARHGLGFSAKQGSSNSATDGTEAFDLPAGCA